MWFHVSLGAVCGRGGDSHLSDSDLRAPTHCPCKVGTVLATQGPLAFRLVVVLSPEKLDQRNRMQHAHGKGSLNFQGSEAWLFEFRPGIFTCDSDTCAESWAHAQTETDYLSVLGLYFLVYSLASSYVSRPWSWSSFLMCFRCEVQDFVVFNAGCLMPWEPHGGKAKP